MTDIAPGTLSFNVSERINTEDGLASNKMLFYKSPDGSVYSVYPPTAFLTFSNWIYMVPPFKPADVLMLGYAGGTTAGLIKQIYGQDVEIVGVDISVVDNRHGSVLIHADAREFVKTARAFDVVIIDLFIGQKTPAFVSDFGFMEDIARITKRFLVIHTDPEIDIGVYEQRFTRLRMMDIGHRLYYYRPAESHENFFCPSSM